MTLDHSPWPLFSDDLEFAQGWMRGQLNHFPMTGETGHTALNIGLRDEIEKHLASQQKDSQDEQSSDDQLRFRLARMDGARNPYRELIPRCHHGNVCSFVAKAAQSKTPLAVQLFGGLGDQLEMLSLVLPWGSRHNVPLRLIANEERCQLLAPLLPEHASIERFDPDTFSPFAQSMAIRMGLFEHDPNSRFAAWIDSERPTRNLHGMVCCWQAVGRGSSLSAHSRSVPFPLVHNFYKRLVEREPQTKIFDITAWQPWEMERFKKLGVIYKNPLVLGLTGLVNLCRSCHVLSIDTALIHLCAAMGHEADLLLPRFPDERWVELFNPQHNYGQYLNIHRSTHFGSWASVMASLSLEGRETLFPIKQ